MDKFCLGIIGRCLSCQPWINTSDLYHRQLRDLLEKNNNIIMRVSIASYSELEPYKRMEILYNKKTLDGVLYFMRSVLNEPLLNHLGKYRYSLHPNFFKLIFAKKKIVYSEDINVIKNAFRIRKLKDSHDLYDNPISQSSNIPSQRFIFGISLRQLNFLAGRLLNPMKIATELYYFERLRKFCLEKKIPLFVIGPITDVKNLINKNSLSLLKKMEKKFQKKFKKHQILNYYLYSLTDEMGQTLYKKDQQHFSFNGHAFLARQLYPILSVWMKSILDEKKTKKY